MGLKALLTGVALLIASPLSAGSLAAADLRFVALGDMPYGKPDKVYPLYESLIEAVNARRPAFVIHVGDTKSAGTPCTDEVLDAQRAYLNSFTPPTLYTPGDNEWTDCHRRKAGGYDVLERLGHIRRTYFERPDDAFGRKPMAVEHQGARGFPENVRVMLGDVMVVTAHVVGSNNGFEPRSPGAVAEFFARDAANIDWVKDSFRAAGDAGADALVLAYHADIFEFDFGETGNGKWLRHSGFRAFGKAVRKQARKFGKPVLLVFGDSHRHRVFRPFPDNAPDVLALEVFGADEMHAVEVTVRRDRGGAVRFEIEPLLNPAL